MRQCRECLLSVGYIYTLHLYAVHFAKHLGRVDLCVGHAQPRRVPQSGTRSGREEAMLDHKSSDMPERIFTFKTTVARHYVCTAFQGRLAGMDCNVVELYIMTCKQRTLSAKLFVLDDFHKLILIGFNTFCKINKLSGNVLNHSFGYTYHF